MLEYQSEGVQTKETNRQTNRQILKYGSFLCTYSVLEYILIKCQIILAKAIYVIISVLLYMLSKLLLAHVKDSEDNENEGACFHNCKLQFF